MQTIDDDDLKAQGTDTGLTKFQLRILAIAQGDSEYGLGIKEELSHYYGEEINHGRLYANLDELAERGLIEVGRRDGRTNDYAITHAGERALGAEIQWLLDQVGLRAVDADHRLADAEPATMEGDD